jgi:hypothetical protein
MVGWVWGQWKCMIGAGRDNEAKRRQSIGSSLMDGCIKTEVHASHLVRNPG